MATVNKEVAENIIANDGYYNGDRSPMGDPRVIKVVRYNNMFDGAYAYGLIYQGDDPMRYHNAGACDNPTTLWEADTAPITSDSDPGDEQPDEGFPGW